MISIAQMKKENWTERQVARESLDRLNKQGAPSFVAGSVMNCLYYYEENNTKCAVGILLPDSYKSLVKDLLLNAEDLVGVLEENNKLQMAKALEHYLPVLNYLQNFHDTATNGDWRYFTKGWPAASTLLSKYYGSKKLEKLYNKLNGAAVSAIATASR